mmetsp:Transcript_131484/g.340477  ORF Transcript_131484/g.340477 Transcript_131484/m.340477 type:complete len:306 (+) Transcript_131484:60-977(+)
MSSDAPSSSTHVPETLGALSPPEPVLSGTDMPQKRDEDQLESDATRAAERDLQCSICFNLFVAPVTTSCGHSFCRHCLTSVLNAGQTSLRGGEVGRCPLCRATFQEHLRIDDGLQERILASVSSSRAPTASMVPGPPGNIRHLRARCATRNRHDSNLTCSREFLLHLGPGSEVEMDVLWGGGTGHDTYKDTTCRCEGGSYDVATGRLVVERVSYSNGPWEYWEVMLLPTGSCNDELIGVAGRYEWHGWEGRYTTGHLFFESVARDSAFSENPGSAGDWQRRRSSCAALHNRQAEYTSWRVLPISH